MSDATGSVPNPGSVGTAKPAATEYRDEKGIVDHFVLLLEDRLAGRRERRIIARPPVDVCHLGVLGPWRQEVDELEEECDGEVGEAAKEGTVPPVAERQPGDTSQAESAKSDKAEEEDRGPVEGSEDRDYTRRPPSSLGFEILVEAIDDAVELEVDTRFAVYTRHLPTLDEQKVSLGGGGVEEEAAKDGEMSLAEVSQRRDVEVPGLRFRIGPQGPWRLRDEGVVQQELSRVLDEAMVSSDIRPEFDKTPKIPVAEMAAEAKFQGWLEKSMKRPAARRPGLNASLEVRARRQADGKFRVSVYLRNNTARGTRTEDNYNILADAGLTGRLISGKLRPVEILPVPEDYQYDRNVWGVGHNTSVEVNPGRTQIETRALARFEQPRLTTQSDPPARFEDLDRNPFTVLGTIRKEMDAYAAQWAKVIEANELGLDQEALGECRKDLDGFRLEADHYAAGVAALASDERLLKAFCGMNRVMGRLASGYDRWRLFQIVFLVTQLPVLVLREGIADGEWPAGVQHSWPEDLEWGDVLWFPTGGGKTEAYLGLVCCAMLYDRLRGKTLGMTAWLRFPLRMLSVQQLQRAMRMIWEAEKERQALLGDAAAESDPLRLGYFVGGTTTPNRLDDDFFRKHPDEASCEIFRVVPDCPACGGEGTVQVVRDPEARRLRHMCAACSSQLPLMVADEEVYRYLPALLVGTIDKMATVGLQPLFGILWAGPKWRCPKHGYGFGKYCLWGCEVKEKDRRPVVAYDSAPTFHIQDELHLLQEELGAFAGHYETLTRHCERVVGSNSAKIVAATATIEGFEHQVRHLYGTKGARRFPRRGYKRHESFYAALEKDPDDPEKPKVARVFISFRPPSGSPSDAAGRCAKILHEAICSMLKDPYGGLAAVPTLPPGDLDALRDLLFYYTATLTYVGSLSGGTRVKDMLQGVAQSVYPGIRDLNVEYLSSRSSTGEVSQVIHRMDQPPSWEDPQHLDSIVATNMISHGVDLERINLMVMDKFPAETAEYIQASSRSGRKKVGLIAVILPSFNLRAVSIYHRFKEYHQHLDRMVSPVPVNRFAKYALHRTISGLVSGLLYGSIGPEENDRGYNDRRRALDWLESHKDEAERMLRSAYATGKGVYESDLETSLVETMLNQYEALLSAVRPSQEKFLTDAMRPKPMMSLRDVDKGIPFFPESRDAYFLEWFRRGGG